MMKRGGIWICCALGCLALSPSHGIARQVASTPQPGIYTNEEQVYFDKEAGRITPWVGVTISETQPTTDSIGVKVKLIDAFGQMLPEDFTEAAQNGIWENEGTEQGTLKIKMGRDTILLRRARPATCWAAIPKDKTKTDGSPDWFFQRDIKIFDQGGRARIGGGDTGAPELVIRMRNVIWPASADGKPNNNRPSMVLYIHKPDRPDSAESYVWADPGAARIGINLRWMQASCTIDGADTPSQVTPKTFRG
jgi:hypothetical protein